VNDPLLRPDGVAQFDVDLGRFWNDWKTNFDKRKPEDVQFLFGKVKWTRKEMEAFKAKYTPSMEQRTRILAHYFPTAPPLANAKVIVNEPSLRPDGVAPFEDKIGRFWHNWKRDFDKKKPEDVEFLFSNVKWAWKEIEGFQKRKAEKATGAGNATAKTTGGKRKAPPTAPSRVRPSADSDSDSSY